MHPVVYVAVAVVLTVYVGGAVQVVRMAMRSTIRRRSCRPSSADAT